jgi:hypothetical protein
MKRSGFRAVIAAIAILFGGATAAWACSCIRPATPAEAGPMARAALEQAVAIVEADVLTGYDTGRRAAERVRVRRVLWGSAPRTLTLIRRSFASSASCDLLFEAGQRRIMILYRAGDGGFRPHGLCSDFLVRPDYLPVLLREARRLRR